MMGAHRYASSTLYTDLEFETRNRVRAEAALERLQHDLQRLQERELRRRREVIVGTLSSALSWAMLATAFAALVLLVIK